MFKKYLSLLLLLSLIIQSLTTRILKEESSEKEKESESPEKTEEEEGCDKPKEETDFSKIH